MEQRAEKLIEIFTELLEQHYSDERSACRSSLLCSLNSNDIKVLCALDGKTNPNIKEISEELQFPMSTLTGIFNKLVEKGLVNRIRCSSDRRIVRVNLTPTGKEAAKLKKQSSYEFAMRILQPLQTEEQKQLLELLQKIINDCR